MTQLTSVQEAAFNAAGEAMADLGARFYLTRDALGAFRAWGYVDGDYNKSTVFGDTTATAAEAVRSFLTKHEEEKAKPAVLAKPVEVRAAAAALIEEYRGKDQALFDRRDIDELADRIAALPVKE